jgi:hypothetical protein
MDSNRLGRLCLLSVMVACILALLPMQAMAGGGGKTGCECGCYIYGCSCQSCGCGLNGCYCGHVGGYCPAQTCSSMSCPCGGADCGCPQECSSSGGEPCGGAAGCGPSSCGGYECSCGPRCIAAGGNNCGGSANCGASPCGGKKCSGTCPPRCKAASGTDCGGKSRCGVSPCGGAECDTSCDFQCNWAGGTDCLGATWCGDYPDGCKGPNCSYCGMRCIAAGGTNCDGKKTKLCDCGSNECPQGATDKWDNPICSQDYCSASPEPVFYCGAEDCWCGGSPCTWYSWDGENQVTHRSCSQVCWESIMPVGNSTPCGAHYDWDTYILSGGVKICKDDGCGGDECDCGPYYCNDFDYEAAHVRKYPCACWGCDFNTCVCEAAGDCGDTDECVCTNCSFATCPCANEGDCGSPSCACSCSGYMSCYCANPGDCGDSDCPMDGHDEGDDPDIYTCTCADPGSCTSSSCACMCRP